MTSARMDLALLFGSTERLCEVVAMWAAEQVWTQRHFSLDVVGPDEIALPMHGRHKNDTEVSALRRRLRLRKADAFVVVIPEHDHAYPAALQPLIDSTTVAWQAKPIAFVAYGGSSVGMRAVEQLRLVCAEHHTVTIPDTVNFTDVRRQFDSSGRLLEPHRPAKAMAAMLRQLHWWAAALHDARKMRPYNLVGDRAGTYSGVAFRSGATSIGSEASAAHSCSEAV